MRARFCGLGRLSLLSTGIGNMIMTKSVAMLMPALVNHIEYSSMHVPLRLLFQKSAIGLQAKILPKTVQMEYVTIIPRTTQHVIRKPRKGKSR